MATGQEKAQVALDICRDVTASLGMLSALDAGWKSEMLSRLEAVSNSLAAMQDRFFLRSKLCLPYANKCEQEAERLCQALRAVQAEESEARARFQEALDALEQATRQLDERSLMQGMVIT